MEITNLSGTIIADLYQLTELLGEGGSGSTYRAIRIEDGVSVAIKILSLRHLNDWKQLELFEREAKVLSQLNHPQIPKYLEYFHVDTPDNRAFYIVQQLAHGKPLTAWVQSGWRSTELEVRDIANQLLEILQYLHQQTPPLIHRDLKPHNIIRNNYGRVFLVDFGAVQDVYNNTLLKGSTVAGTFGYMAPEQFRGLAVPASDLYGLGATILYLLTHRSPADLPQERLKLSFRDRVNISDSFADWLEMMIEPDTFDRFPSADAALITLQKQHRFRIQRGTKIGFPLQGVAITAAILTITVPIVHQYQYAFLAVVGLQPRDLCAVISNNDTIALNEYLNRGVNSNASVTLRDNANITGSLLHCAIESGHAEIVKDLLNSGANPNVHSSDDLTPIHRAVKTYCQSKSCQSSLAILHHLLDYKAKINAESNVGHPLVLAIEINNVQAFEDLIKLGADPHTLSNLGLSLWYFLSVSVEDNKGRNQSAIREIARQLVATGVDVNKPDYGGMTPLHTAVQNGHKVSSIEMLLNNNARIDVRNDEGSTPLISAIEIHDFDVIKMFLDRGGGVNFSGKDGKTPLMVAIKPAQNNSINLKIVKILLDRGANKSFLDPANRNVLEHIKSAPPCDEFDCYTDPHKLFNKVEGK